jgi:hypothetical protein
VVPKLTTSNNVPTCPWHNVQSMAQLLSSQPTIIAWGILTTVSGKAQVRPQVPTPNCISFQAQVAIWVSYLPCMTQQSPSIGHIVRHFSLSLSLCFMHNLAKGFSWKGVHIMLCKAKNILGQMVKEESCRIEGPNVSGINCTITWQICDVNENIPSQPWT